MCTCRYEHNACAQVAEQYASPSQIAVPPATHDMDPLLCTQPHSTHMVACTRGIAQVKIVTVSLSLTGAVRERKATLPNCGPGSRDGCDHDASEQDPSDRPDNDSCGTSHSNSARRSASSSPLKSFVTLNRLRICMVCSGQGAKQPTIWH